MSRCSDRIRADPLQEAEGQQVRGSEPVGRLAQGLPGRPKGRPTAAPTKLPTGRNKLCY